MIKKFFTPSISPATVVLFGVVGVGLLAADATFLVAVAAGLATGFLSGFLEGWLGK